MKSVPEMLMELRQIRLPEKTRQYLNQMQELLSEGMDDAIDVNTVRKIYERVAPMLRKARPKPMEAQVAIPPFAQMIEELDRSSMMIVKEPDREFIQGIKLLLQMQEAITQSDAQRAQKIYLEFRQNLHRSQEMRG